MIRSPFLLGQPVCETETDGITQSVMLLSALRLTLVRLLYLYISEIRHLVGFMSMLSPSYCENKLSVFSYILPVEGYLPFLFFLWGGEGVQLIFHPSFMLELRLRSALPQHPLIVKGKDKVALVYIMKYRRGGSRALTVQPNSDLGRPIVEVYRPHTVRHTHSHTHTHSKTHSHTHTHTHSKTHSLTHTHTHTVRHTHSHTHTHGKTHSLTHTHTHSKTPSLTHTQ